LLRAEIRADRLPLSQTAASLPGAQEAALAGGDDYELLFTAPATKRGAIEHLARQLDMPLAHIGTLHDGSDVRVLDAHGQLIAPTSRGWQHF
jgi:thiamine-monophosphate kinase